MMRNGNEGGAKQETHTYDGVVEDLNFDPESPNVQPHPDHPGPGAHASHHDEAKDRPPEDS
jgi:hypothetical protein